MTGLRATAGSTCASRASGGHGGRCHAGVPHARCVEDARERGRAHRDVDCLVARSSCGAAHVGPLAPPVGAAARARRWRRPGASSGREEREALGRYSRSPRTMTGLGATAGSTCASRASGGHGGRCRAGVPHALRRRRPRASSALGTRRGRAHRDVDCLVARSSCGAAHVGPLAPPVGAAARARRWRRPGASSGREEREALGRYSRSPRTMTGLGASAGSSCSHHGSRGGTEGRRRCRAGVPPAGVMPPLPRCAYAARLDSTLASPGARCPPGKNPSPLRR